MIVDGICIQFLGCFDCRPPTQQISGVGRVQLDENYYRELAANSSEPNKDEPVAVPPVIMSKASRTPTTTTTTTKSKATKKPLIRSQTISEDRLTKSSLAVEPPAVPSISEYPRLLSHYPSPPSIPIAIPSVTPTAFLPFNQSQSLPAYVLPANHHIAYIANPTSADLNPSVFVIANPNHQQLHLLTPFDYRSIPLTNSAFHPCNILPSKRPDQDATPSTTTTSATSKANELLPLKKRRRYTGETSRPDETK